MQLIHSLRRIERVMARPVFHPFVIAPFVGQIPDDRRGAWRYLTQERIGVGLIDRVTHVRGNDVIFVHCARSDAAYEA